MRQAVLITEPAKFGESRSIRVLFNMPKPNPVLELRHRLQAELPLQPRRRDPKTAESFSVLSFRKFSGPGTAKTPLRHRRLFASLIQESRVSLEKNNDTRWKRDPVNQI